MTGPGVAPVRWLPLAGAANARDLGGLPVAGGVLRPGLVLRSDNLQGLTADDVRYLVDEVGLRTVLDLRTDAERRSEGPGPLAATAVRHVALSLVPELAGDRVLPDRRGDDPVEIYLAYLADFPERVVAALHTLADPAAGPTLFHCAAGKDRTGVLAAMTLSLLGAADAVITADYLATNERLDRLVARLVASPTYRRDVSAVPVAAHGPRPETMTGFLAGLAARHGGAAGWAEQHGFDAAARQRLAARLVLPTAG